MIRFRPGKGYASLSAAAVWPIDRAQWRWGTMAKHWINANGFLALLVIRVARLQG